MSRKLVEWVELEKMNTLATGRGGAGTKSRSGTRCL